MNKLFILIILVIPLVFASPEPITVLTLHYNNGDISYVKESSTEGYAPSIYEGDYELRIFSDTQILSLNFLPPVKEFQDGFTEEKIFGGLIKRNDFDFSLIVPKLSDKEEKIVIQPDGTKINLKKNKFLTYFIIFLIFLIIISIIILIKKLRS